MYCYILITPDTSSSQLKKRPLCTWVSYVTPLHLPPKIRQKMSSFFVCVSNFVYLFCAIDSERHLSNKDIFGLEQKDFTKPRSNFNSPQNVHTFTAPEMIPFLALASFLICRDLSELNHHLRDSLTSSTPSVSPL